ncbi:MAG TPA: lipase family protein, partial [Thermoanaerobaculia bacterium]|nr:lipase family protein [Thermoanaerobaculia bacterium]
AEVTQRAQRRTKGERCMPPFPIYRDAAAEMLAAHASSDASTRHPTVAHILSVAAGYAYAEIETMARMMSRTGFAEHATVSVSETVDAMYINTTAYLTQSRCGRVVILSYRGTPPASLVTWLGDADVGSESMRIGGDVVPVHSGFYRNFRATRLAIFEELTAALRGRSLVDPNKKLDSPLQALYVTGHSLGGALAVLFALSLCAPERRALADRLRAVYTFGQPMTVGEPLPEAARVVSAKIFRHVLARDIVPLLPPAGWGVFAHIGREFRYENGAWHLQKNVAQPLSVREIPRAMMAAIAPAKRADTAQYTAAVHPPHHYISALRPPGLVTEFGDE